MRLREVLIGTALMSIALITTRASAPTGFGDEVRHDFADGTKSAVEPGTRVPLVSVPSPLISEDRVLGSAYYDTLSILSESNRCSDFFGGSAASVEVFNELVGKIRKDFFSVGVAMRMSGSTTNIHNAYTKKNHRTFAKVSLNLNGPFYRKRFAASQPMMPGVGTFEPNTKEARVLILLHELGHVMKGANGDWLLPDDGKDEALSRVNSRRIEDICGEEIRSLSKVTATKALGKYQDLDEQPVP
jgi:hypothetical protein